MSQNIIVFRVVVVVVVVVVVKKRDFYCWFVSHLKCPS